MQEDVDEIRLVTERVRPAEHGVFGLLLEAGERAGVDEWSDAIDEKRRILIECKEPSTARIVDIFVQHAGDFCFRQRGGERTHIGAAAKAEKLHEEPRIRALRLTILHAAFSLISGGSGPLLVWAAGAHRADHRNSGFSARVVTVPSRARRDVIVNLMKLAVYLPALNEAETIGEVLDGIPSAIPRITSITKIVVDDGSSDGTAAVAELHGAIVVRHPRNLGPGGFQVWRAGRSCQRRGHHRRYGRGRPVPVRDLAALIAPIVNGEADVVLCTRFGPGSQLAGKMPPAKRLGNWLLCRIISFTVQQRLTDVSCGFRAFSRDAALGVDIRSDFEYAHESLLTWHRLALRLDCDRVAGAGGAASWKVSDACQCRLVCDPVGPGVAACDPRLQPVPQSGQSR
jgi:hypothetical protein